MKIIVNDNITYRLGRNANENFQLIDNASPDDWWFHLDGHPSGHVIIDSDIIDTPIKMFAGQLVKDYSKMKYIKNVKIVFTQVKNIVKTKVIGTVILKQSEFFYI